MAERFIEELFILNKKLDELLLRYNLLKDENMELKEEAEALKTKLREREDRYKELEINYERIKLSGALLGEGEKRTDAKRRITELVREIDRCVALLNR
ncbi:MAG: hypothetical protein ACOXZV_11080 [Bacteroidales bacterium]|jgi:wobble nucleotide-excising tRNase